MLGKIRMASGREEAFKACVVSFVINQEGSVLLAVFLRSRPCSDIAFLPTCDLSSQFDHQSEEGTHKTASFSCLSVHSPPSKTGY